jgi:hypothetical protein
MTSSFDSQMHPYLVDTDAMLPTAFVLGPPKAASTFLWDCIARSFHPQAVCKGSSVKAWSDKACADQRFVLPGLQYASWTGACFHERKEGNTPWMVTPTVTSLRWHVWGGPQLSLEHWSATEPRMCGHRNNSAFAEYVEDQCMADSPCGLDQRPGYNESAAPECLRQCTPCELHPGVDEYISSGSVHHRPCKGTPFLCASRTCISSKFMSKRLNNHGVDHWNTHKRNFDVMNAFPHRDELVRQGISPRRLSTLEGNPGLFAGGGTPLAEPIAASLTPSGMSQLRFVVGYRSPLSLVLSYWAFEGKHLAHLEQYMSAAVARLDKCDTAVGASGRPDLLLSLSSTDWRTYRACMMNANNYVATTLYAVHLTHWVRAGFNGSQFLLVPTRAMGNGQELRSTLADFLGLPSPSATRSCTAQQNAQRGHEDRQFVSARNMTVGELRAAFPRSPAGIGLRAYVDRHDALLAPLVEREGVRVHGGVGALAPARRE